MIIQDPIIGEKLILKTLAVDDAQGPYKNWVKSSDVNQYLELRHSILDVAGLKLFIEEMNTSENNVLLGIFIQNNHHIGNIKLGPIDWYNERGIMGLMIGEQTVWGKGYGTEAVRLLTNYAFDSLKLKSLHASCYSENLGSYKVFTKAGYLEEGRQKQYWKTANGFNDNVLLGKLRT